MSSALLVMRSDPVAGPFGTQADVSWRGKRLLARVPMGSGAFDGLTVGDRVVADVRVRAVPAPQPWRVARHLAGDLTVDAVHERHPATGMWGIADAVRARYQRAFDTVPGRLRPLAAGFVLGDDRGQRPEIAADFRASGLGHLLVVSGQNVAFVLAAVRPMVDRLRLRWRVVGIAVVLVVFGTVTRWEPSVVRAVAMAAAAAFARSAGRPQPALRIVGLGVGAVVLIDPLLVWSLGFTLSVGATLGLALLAEPWERRLVARGVRPWLAAPLAATLAAQALTVWLVLPISGGVPVASVLANVAAAPLAGPAMVLGVVLGAVGGFVRPGVADVVLTPFELLLGAVAAVARITAALPLGRWGAAHLGVMWAGTVVVALAGRRSAGRSGRAARIAVRLAVRGAVVAVAAAVAAGPVAGARNGGVAGLALDGGARLWAEPSGWRSQGAVVVVLSGRVDDERLLDALRRRGVRTVDVVAVPRPGRAALAGVAAVRSRFGPARFVGPGALLAGPTPSRSGRTMRSWSADGGSCAGTARTGGSRSTSRRRRRRETHVHWRARRSTGVDRGAAGDGP